MATSRIEGDVFVNGNLASKTGTPAAASITNESVAGAAAIEATKLQHQHRLLFAQANTAAVDETRMVYVCYGVTGTVIAFSAGSIAKAVGDATCTFDLKKNGTTILTGVITLNSSSVNRVVQAGTLTGSTALVAGDVLEVVVDATIGTGTLPTGVFAAVTVNEKAQ